MLFVMEKSCKEFDNRRQDEANHKCYIVKWLAGFSSVDKMHSLNNVFISDKFSFKGVEL